MATIKSTTRVCLPALLLLGAAAAACLGSGGGRVGDQEAPPSFLTPVAEAQEDGIDLYWMGLEFEAGGLSFGIDGTAVYPVHAGPGLAFMYAGDIGNGNVVFSLFSYSGRGGGGPVTRERALSIPGTTVEKTQVGPWAAELLALPAGTGTVNQRWVYVDMGETVVVAMGHSGSIAPGIDANPLTDPDLLIEVVAEHLRPYPE